MMITFSNRELQRSKLWDANQLMEMLYCTCNFSKICANHQIVNWKNVLRNLLNNQKSYEDRIKILLNEYDVLKKVTYQDIQFYCNATNCFNPVKYLKNYIWDKRYKATRKLIMLEAKITKKNIFFQMFSPLYYHDGKNIIDLERYFLRKWKFDLLMEYFYRYVLSLASYTRKYFLSRCDCLRLILFFKRKKNQEQISFINKEIHKTQFIVTTKIKEEWPSIIIKLWTQWLKFLQRKKKALELKSSVSWTDDLEIKI